MKNTIIGLLLICAMAIGLVGCSTEAQARDLMEGITPREINTTDISAENARVTDFAVRLFKAGEESGKNTLISPLSVLLALGMTSNGAEGETRLQMEEVLGMTIEELNPYLYSYVQSLPQGDKYKLHLANSIWFAEDERFTVNQGFLQTTADYYGADIYKVPFSNESCNNINRWVKENTDGMIEKILDRISDDAVMYLVNALAFEAKWADGYGEHQVKDGEFTKEDSAKQKAEFMHSTESAYLEDENATGFIKYYSNRKYAFVAMLPNKGVSVSEYIASLDGKSLNALLANPKHGTVYASIPKFETDYDVEMSEILKEMGMPLAFDPMDAEFGGLGTSTGGNIYISRVLHKTTISVDETGTKAGAATAVEMSCGSALPQNPKEVYLDRPFVYMLIDCKNNIPFFIGTLMDVK